MYVIKYFIIDHCSFDHLTQAYLIQEFKFSQYLKVTYLILHELFYSNNILSSTFTLNSLDLVTNKTKLGALNGNCQNCVRKASDRTSSACVSEQGLRGWRGGRCGGWGHETANQETRSQCFEFKGRCSCAQHFIITCSSPAKSQKRFEVLNLNHQ